MIRSASCVILIAFGSAAIAQPKAIVSKPSANKAGEALLAQWSPEKAAQFLDGVGVNWTREKNCGTCHTNYPYLIARPLLKPAGDGWKEVRAFFEERASNWDSGKDGSKPRWDAEVVTTAVSLALSDANTTGKLHPVTKSALDRIWIVQRKDGGFDWLKCGWPPFEHDDYFGAVFAAVGVGMAPGEYQFHTTAKDGIDRLKGFLTSHPAPDLHHKTWLLWASTRVAGLMNEREQKKTIEELLVKQRDDGGWCLPALGDWKRRDGTPNDPKAESDGYATGLIVYVLRKAGLGVDDPAVKKGYYWLKSHQAETGRWFTRSLNNDKAHYLTNAGTAFAVMALKACE
jgi:squalene-hopene/tetraprenyl-beta-curcumene cyclase